MIFNENKILVTGGNGRLGKEFKKLLPDALYPTSKELNIKSAQSISYYFYKHNIDCVIHLAAKTDVIACETDKEDAWKTNVFGTTALIENAKMNGAKLFIYLNTACIFSGDDGIEYYNEDSEPNPKHFYGMTKLFGEYVVLAADSPEFQTISVRTNFTSMPWEYPKAFTDRFSTYIFAETVAQGVIDIIIEKPNLSIIHICGDKKVSMYDYALAGGSKVKPMTMKDFDTEDITLTQNMCLTSLYWKLYQLKKEEDDLNVISR